LFNPFILSTAASMVGVILKLNFVFSPSLLFSPYLLTTALICSAIFDLSSPTSILFNSSI